MIDSNSSYPKIIIIPTIHVSKSSSLFIEQLFKYYNPTHVAIELCIERYYNYVNISNIKILTTSKNLIHRIKKKLFNSILMKINKKINNTYYNEDFGIDIRKSIYLAKKYSCYLYLIDRILSATINSFFKKLSFMEIVYLFFIYLKSKIFHEIELFNINKYTVNISKQCIDNILVKIKKIVPSYYDVVIKERNIILSNNILKVVSELNSNDTLFVITGYGHFYEICQYLKKK